MNTFVDHLRSKATEVAHNAGSAIQDAQRRVTQQVLEATGNAERTELEDELPELATHHKLEGVLKRLHHQTEKYYRSVHSLCQLSAQISQARAEHIRPLRFPAPARRPRRRPRPRDRIRATRSRVHARTTTTPNSAPPPPPPARPPHERCPPTVRLRRNLPAPSTTRH